MNRFWQIAVPVVTVLSIIGMFVSLASPAAPVLALFCAFSAWGILHVAYKGADSHTSVELESMALLIGLCLTIVLAIAGTIPSVVAVIAAVLWAAIQGWVHFIIATEPNHPA